MIPFDMVEPTSLAEAISLLDPEEPTIRAVAGGTALMLMMKAGVFQPSRLICLHHIEPEYARITATPAGELHIGAMVTLSELEHDANVAKYQPALKRGLGRLSNPRVRNVARVGGALAHGDPHMDLPPMLTALGARVTIKSPDADRELPLEQLFVGYYETALDKNELITSVTVPAPGARKSAYMKVTSRSADDWPAVGVAVSFESKAGTIHDPIIVVSAATEKVTRLSGVEKILQGAAPEDAVLQRAADAAIAETSILADAHGTAAYKRELLRVYVQRAVRRAWGDGAEVRQ